MADRPHRRLAAILCADVAGYSRLVAGDEEGTIRAVKGHIDALELVIGLHHGRVFKTTGDGILVEFGSVVDAVSAAAAMQASVAERNRGVPDAARVDFRIGVHVGDVVAEGDDMLGDGVNIAARIEAEAPPGGVLVSARVHEDVDGKLAFEFVDVGMRQLKNIDRPMRLYELRPAHSAAQHRPVIPVLPDKPSVAVLPFLSMPAGLESDYFADGLTEDVITALAGVPWLFVIARNSSFTYKGTAVDVRQIGRELGVRYILEGSVRHAGTRLRVTGQLIDASTGAHLWADRYDGALADVFELQDRMTEAVVAAIAPEIRSAEITRASAKRPENLTAYDHYLRALSALNRAQVGDGAAFLDASIDAAPGFAKAIAMRAWCHTLQVSWGAGARRADHAVAGIAAANAALDAGDADPEVAAYAGYALAFFCEQIERGMTLVRDAATRCPSFAWAHTSCALLEAFHGDPRSAFAACDVALRLSPRDPMVFRVHLARAWAWRMLFNDSEMLSAARQVLALNPNVMPAHTMVVQGHAALGEFDAARAAADALLVRFPDFTVSGYTDLHDRLQLSAKIGAAVTPRLLEAGLPP